MKYFLIILLSFAANAKVFTVSANWSCSRLDISNNTAKLPKSSKLNIRIDNKSGELTIIPDIFNESDLNGKDTIVNSSSCVKRLLTKVDNALKKFTTTCSNCSITPSKIVSDLKNQISVSNYFKNSSLPKLPRVYSGHDEYVLSTVNDELVNKFCSSSKMSSMEVIAVSSLDFLDHMKSMISSNKNAFKEKCIEDVKKIHEKFAFKKTDCQAKTCKSIIKNSEEKEKKYQKLSEKFQYAQNKEDIKNLEANGYHEASPVTEALILKNAIKDPKKCSLAHTVKVNRRYVSIYKFDNAISKLIDSSLEDLSQRCIRQIVQTYISHKEGDRSLDDELCSSDYCKKKTSVYHENILKLMSYNHSKKQLEYFCKNQPKDKLYGSFFKTWDELDNVLECTELKVGETRALKSLGDTTVGHYHGLKRLSDKKYEATLAIDFVSTDDGQNADMRKRVNECISKTSEYFKGAGGEQMDVKVITPSQNKKRPEVDQLEVVKIDIAAKGQPFRSHSEKYEASISCEVITHELLHLMGLVDEYHEHTNQVYYKRDTKEVYNPRYFPKDKDKSTFETTTAYGCRSRSKGPSVMSSHYQRFQESVKKQVACKCVSSECSKFMENENNAKASLFALPERYKIGNYCERKYVKTETLKDDFNFSGDYYSDVKSSDQDLDFTVKEFSMGSDLAKPTLVSYRYECNCTSDKCNDYIKYYNDSFISKNKFTSRSYCFSGSKNVKAKSSDIASVSTPPYSSNKNGEFSFTTTPEMDSLLMPAHFEKMKWGSCDSKSTKYKTCAKYAYKSLDFECADKPKFCDSDEGWLLSTK